MVRGIASREEIRADEDAGAGNCVSFGDISDKRCPDRNEVSQLERVRFMCEVELDL
jgi:hypothetical protein